jgi:tetratricopeptide (TPR) repeat protein
MAPEDLGRAVTAGRELAGLVGDSDPGLLSSLALVMFEWFSQTRDPDDLRLAVDLGRRSVRTAAERVDEQTRRLANLFAAELVLAEQTELIADYDTAIATAHAAVELFDDADSARAKHLGNLAAAWCGRFQRSGSEDDLRQALQHARAALRGADESEKIQCCAILLAVLAYRLDRFDDLAALDEAVKLLDDGWHVDLAWLNSVRELVGALQRRGDELAIDPHIVDTLLPALNEGLLRASVEMASEGANRRSTMLLDLAMTLVDLAEFIGGAPNLTLYQGLRGQVLLRQWQINGVRGDLDTAIDLLIKAASEAASSAPEWASQTFKDAAFLLYRRYRRRRHRADLEEACQHLERALVLAGDEADERSSIQAMLHDFRRHLAKPPMMMIHSDLGEVDRENLASPHGTAVVHDWNSGEPRESGLSWVHADESDDTADVSASPRVLFLRTFNDDNSGYVVINSLAAALDDGAGRIEIVSDQRDRDAIEHHWSAAFGARPSSERIDFITAPREGWRRVVLERMAATDVIVLHLSPKDVDFPEFPFGPSVNQIPTGEDFWKEYVNAPMSRPITGPGLLREVSYINRTNMLPITVVVCDERYQGTLNDLIALSGAMGDATDLAGNFITPRLAAIDKQVGHLRTAYRGISFQRREDVPVLPDLAAAIRRALADMRAEKITRRPMPWRLQDLSGRTSEPRGLPPDNKAKIVAFSDVEDVLFLPQGEITEISHGEMLTVLDREAIAHGCPYCQAPIDRIFFFVDGLKTVKERSEAGLSHVRARCQICGRRSSYQGDGYLQWS